MVYRGLDPPWNCRWSYPASISYLMNSAEGVEAAFFSGTHGKSLCIHVSTIYVCIYIYITIIMKISSIITSCFVLCVQVESHNQLPGERMCYELKLLQIKPCMAWLGVPPPWQRLGSGLATPRFTCRAQPSNWATADPWDSWMILAVGREQLGAKRIQCCPFWGGWRTKAMS